MLNWEILNTLQTNACWFLNILIQVCVVVVVANYNAYFQTFVGSWDWCLIFSWQILPWRYPGTTSLVVHMDICTWLLCIFLSNWSWQICKSTVLYIYNYICACVSYNYASVCVCFRPLHCLTQMWRSDLGPCPPQWAARSDDFWRTNNSWENAMCQVTGVCVHLPTESYIYKYI